MLHSRQHLIQWLQDNLTDRILQNLLQNGKLELLGGFNPLPSSSNPGWIIALISFITGRTYYICIGVDEENNILRWWQTKEINWKNWEGDKSDNPLYQGDNFNKYKKSKDETIF